MGGWRETSYSQMLTHHPKTLHMAGTSRFTSHTPIYPDSHSCSPQPAGLGLLPAVPVRGRLRYPGRAKPEASPDIQAS